MKLDNNQYNELKEKLAEQIVASLGAEKLAEEEQPELSEEEVKALLEAKKQEIANRENGEEATEDEAVEELEQKAAMVYEYALNKIAACEDMYADGVMTQQACIETLAEVGLYDENGLNKEAAESSEETIFFTNKVAEEYDDACEKIAAAEEKYAEGIEELRSAMEVLAELGYEFE